MANGNENTKWRLLIENDWEIGKSKYFFGGNKNQNRKWQIVFCFYAIVSIFLDFENRFFFYFNSPTVLIANFFS